MTIEQELAAVAEQSVCVAGESEIAAALDAMALAIRRHLSGDPVVLLCAMNGGVLVAAEMLKRLSLDLQFDYVHATRYRDRTVGDAIEWRVLPSRSLSGCQVVVVDDIFDQGWTLAAIVDYCQEQGASSVLSVVLVDKQHQRKVHGFRPDVVGITLPDHYLYGFGMDYKGFLRNRSAIYAVPD